MPAKTTTQEMKDAKHRQRQAALMETEKAMESATCILPAFGQECCKACRPGGKCPVGGNMDRCVSTNKPH